MDKNQGNATAPESSGPEEGLLEAIEELLGTAGAWWDCQGLAKRAGLNRGQLESLCLQLFHATPDKLLIRLRLEAARRLLATSESVPASEVVGDTASSLGFAGPDAFRRAFLAQERLTPEAYLALRDGTRSLRLCLPEGYQAERVLAHLGRDVKSCSERVEARRGVFALALTVPPEEGRELNEGHPLAIAGRISKDGRECEVDLLPGLDSRAIRYLHQCLLGLLALRIDPGPFEEAALTGEHARLVQGRRGLGIPQTRDPFEGLVWVIAGQQVSLGAAFAMRRRLTRLLGAPVECPDGGRGALLAPPGPRKVSELEESDLHGLGYSRRKAEYLLGVSRAVVRGELDLQALEVAPAPEITSRLLAVRGLGPWSVDYLKMRSYALADCVPVGDVALAKALRIYFDLPERPRGQAMAELMLPFAPHRSLATFHLWASL